MKKYKVIIWGLGNVGRSALVHILSKKTLELVGVYDVDPNKVGKDAGEIFGYGRTGVLVSDDREKVLGVQADVVLYYAPQFYDAGSFAQAALNKNCDDIVDILNHKKNIITTVTIYYSQKLAPELFAKIDAAAKENGVTYMQQGIYPGLFTPYLPVVLAMGSRNVTSVGVYGGEPDELNTAPWAAGFSFGKKLEDMDKGMLDGITTMFMTAYGETMIEIADRLGLEYDEYFQHCDTVLSDRDFDTKNPLYGFVKKGTIGAHILNMGVKYKGKEVAGFHFVHKAAKDILPELSVDFRIEVCGENRVEAKIEGLLPEYCDVFLTSEAPGVNLIPGVVEAEAGFKNALEIAIGKLPA